MATFFVQTAFYIKQYKAISNWLMGPVKSWLNEHNLDLDQFALRPKGLADMISLVASDKISFSAASQQLLPLMVAHPDAVAAELAEKHQLLQEGDADLITPIVTAVIEAFPQKVAEYQKGRKGLLGFFVGEVMKRSKGKAEPKKTNELIRKRLDNTSS